VGQQLEIFCGAVHPAKGLGASGQGVGDVARLDALGGFDGPDAIHQGRQLGTGWLGHSGQIRQCDTGVVDHCAPPACRKLNAVVTSPSPGDVRPTRSASVHATTRVTRSLISKPRRFESVPRRAGWGLVCDYPYAERNFQQ
jgi:hypothetical protein